MNRLNVGGCVNIFPEGRVLPVVPLGMDRVLPNPKKKTETAIWDPSSDLSVVLRRAETDPSPTCCPRSSPTWETG